MNDFVTVIPARFASTRLPGKPLSDIGGLPMIVRVARQAAASGASSVVVAIDDDRIARVLRQHGIDWVMTRADHTSGSDRVMEVVEQRDWGDDTIVVNVQGDEPLIPPSVIDQVAALLRDSPGSGVATLCEPVAGREQVFDPNVVKVLRSAGGRALYFSRAPIPWFRVDFATNHIGPLPQQGWWRHIGIYGYRVGTLRRFCALPVAPIENFESLEQLRLLHNDIDILIEPACRPVPGGVDTAADLARVRALID
jgi:3-deoxy-manno-octulosonate cytidylyltransferase (CMP-KDO synthetase)